MFHFIKNNTGTEEIIVFSRPRAMRLMTGRMAITCRMGEDISAGDYVVIRKREYEDFCDDVLKNVSHGEPVFDNARFMVIKL